MFLFTYAMPALQTILSSRDERTIVSIFPTHCRTLFKSDRSSGTNIALPPSRATLFRNVSQSCPRCSSRHAAITVAPCFTRNVLTARPMPLLAPVTTTHPLRTCSNRLGSIEGLGPGANHLHNAPVQAKQAKQIKRLCVYLLKAWRNKKSYH
jgi:hypothetical protein